MILSLELSPAHGSLPMNRPVVGEEAVPTTYSSSLPCPCTRKARGAVYLLLLLLHSYPYLSCLGWTKNHQADVVPTIFESAFLACFRNGQRAHLIALHVQIHSWVIPTIQLRVSCIAPLMMMWLASGYELEIKRREIKVKWLTKQQGKMIPCKKKG
jgi:hypothetical protein